MMVNDIIEADILIVGSGGAGLRAAIEADDMGLHTVVVDKALFAKSGSTVMSSGDCAAVFSDPNFGDSPNTHFRDTVEGGDYLNNQELVRILVTEAPKRLLDLERFGVFFDRTSNGKLAGSGGVGSGTGGHTYWRYRSHADWGGIHLMRALKSEVMCRDITVMEETMITTLLTDNETSIAGAIGIRRKNADFVVFRAKSLILATGGAGNIYPITSNPIHKTGDGYALAYRAGADLIDMEQVQFHPSGMAYPEGLKGVLVTDNLREKGGIMYNRFHERFLMRYGMSEQTATRDALARAMYAEIKEGRGTEHNALYLDVSHLQDKFIEQNFPSVLENLLDFGIDIREKPIEVTPDCHFFMGGIKINEKCEGTLHGLYAAGEVTGGVHGANRLGGNALTETQVFGALAGRYAAERARSMSSFPKLDEEQIRNAYKKVFEIFNRNTKEGVRPASLKEAIHDIMWRYVFIKRSKLGLKKAITKLEEIEREIIPKLCVSEKSKRYNNDLIEVLEAENMLTVARIIAKAALMRTESRGAHYREDYPKRDDKKWLKNIIVRTEKGKIRLFTKPVVLLGERR